jgi:putative CocE/NonD family hydrolase
MDRDVPVPMGDGVVLRADVWRPNAAGKFPVLVYRTPYDKRRAVEDYGTFRRAVERGYAVVIQDVRGRYASEGEFVPYRHEGQDGYDTIEWATQQSWSNGSVGTFGLSYPGAVQWLAAVESPPHLKAMVPAMTFSTPLNFFYSGGVFDLSWVGWIWNNIAPDTRSKKNLAGPKSYEQASAEWTGIREKLQGHLPLSELSELREVAPYYNEWLRHPPDDPWWEWAEIQNKYERVKAAVLNLSGWYDETYGPEGATTNFRGLMAARRGWPDPQAKLVLGPWTHGVQETGETRSGEREFGAAAGIDYDELVLRWMDRYVRGVDNGVDREKPVRVFVMGENVWREEDAWPLKQAQDTPLYLGGTASAGKPGSLRWTPPGENEPPSEFTSDPANPVVDPFARSAGAHDYRGLECRSDVLAFDSPALDRALEITGPIRAEIYLSCDAPDTDLWVRLMDVAPDGTAFNLMSPGLEVLRASYRNLAPPAGKRRGRKRALLVPGRVYKLRLANPVTSNVFKMGHRIRVQISTSFFPHFSRNLHTGDLEAVSSAMRKARIRVHHDWRRPSRVILPVIPR